MRFEDAWLLWIGAVPVVGWLLILWLDLRHRHGDERFVSISPSRVAVGKLATLRVSGLSVWMRKYGLWLLRLAVFCLVIVALARPQAGSTMRVVDRYGVAIAIVFDTSESMEALDYTINGKPTSRLTAAADILRKFVSKRTDDQLALIPFGDYPFTQVPLTHDRTIIEGFLNQVHTDMVGKRTNVGDALALGVKRLKSANANSRVIILMTDGRSNLGKFEPIDAARLAADEGIRVYTVGIGSTGPSPFKVRGPFGDQIVYQRLELDEDTLQQIATTAKGKYFRANNTKELTSVYDAINELEKSKIEVKIVQNYDDQFEPLIWLALALLLLDIVLRATRYWGVTV